MPRSELVLVQSSPHFLLAIHLHLGYDIRVKELLKSSGYKATSARLAILDVFSKSRKPINAESVYKKLTSKKLDQATVYRTIISFEKSGILRRVDLRKDSVHYELADKHHHHIVCTSCDDLEDFENKEIEKAIEKIWERIVGKSSKFKNINKHSLELFGLCVKCA